MKDYVILVDSCCDLDKEFRQKHNIEYVKIKRGDYTFTYKMRT